MLSTLRLRLAALFTALTCLVLAGALAVSWHMAVEQYDTGQRAMQQAALASLTAQLSQQQLADAWLAQLEASGPYLIFIEDGGQPLAFQGAWQPATGRAALRERAFALADKAGWNNTLPLTLRGDRGDTYTGSTLLFRPGAKGVCRIVLLRPLVGREQFLRTLLWRYGLLGLAGAALLGAASWLLTGLALRPTEKALRRQKEFVAAASHELRGPLAVIKASLQAVQNAPEASPSLLAGAAREADRMERLVADLLALARADAGDWAVQCRPIDLDTFCVEFFDRFSPLAAGRRHRFALELPDAPLPWVRTDPERLVQLLGIFLDNALDYAPTETTVTLEALAMGRTVRLTLRDEGPGIPGPDKQRVFDRFYRAEQSRSSKQHFGLGLSVALELARALGAGLTVADAPGGGAAFHLALPVCHER